MLFPSAPVGATAQIVCATAAPLSSTAAVQTYRYIYVRAICEGNPAIFSLDFLFFIPVSKKDNFILFAAIKHNKAAEKALSSKTKSLMSVCVYASCNEV